jgi:hypothetical protein
MVKSLGQNDIMNIVAQGKNQVISNQQAFNILYPNAKSYYDKTQVNIIDRHFQDVENNLLNELKQSIDSVLDHQVNEKLIRADDMKKPDLSGLNLQNNAPFVHPAAIETEINYNEKKKKDSRVRIMTNNR